MRLTAMHMQESARRKFFMNSTYIMSRNIKIQPFLAQEAEISLTAMYLQESASRKFFMNPTYIMSTKKE